jgi:phage-related protein
LRSSHGDIAKTAERTQTLGAAMGHLRNASEVALQPLASAVWKDINNILIDITKALIPFVTMLANDLPTAMQTLKPYFDILMVDLRATFKILGDVARVVAPLVKVAFDLIGVILDIFTGKWGKAWHSFTAAWRAALDALKAVPRLLIDLIEKPLTEIGAIVNVALGGFMARIERIPSDILNALSGLPSTIANLFSTAWSGLAAVADTAASDFWHWVTQLPTTVVNDLAALGTDVFNAIAGGFRTAVFGAEAGIGAIWGWLGGIGGRIIGALGDIGGMVWGYMSNAFSTVLGGMTNGITAIWGWLGGLGGQIITGLGDIGTQMWNYAVHIMTRFVDGLGSMATAIINKVKSILGPLASLFPFSPPKEGPLSGRGDPIYWGHNIIERIAEGMAGSSGALRSAMSGALGGLETAGAGATSAFMRGGPAVHIDHAHFHDGLDLEAFMKRAAWLAQTAA